MGIAAVKPNFWVIAAIVIGAHLILGWWVLRDPIDRKLIKPASRVVVKTIPLSTKQQVAAAVPVPAPAASAESKMASPKTPPLPKPKSVKKAEKPIAKPKVVKNSSPPKPQEKPPVQIEKTVVQQQRQAAAAKAKAALSQLRQDPIASTLPMVSELTVPVLKSDSAETSTPVGIKAEASYVDGMIARLRTLLRLPEYGEVTLMVTLDRSGQVSNHRVAKAESEANRRYVEKMILGCKFSDFGCHFEGETEHSFTLVLSNDLF